MVDLPAIRANRSRSAIEYWAEVFHHLGLSRMYNVTQLLLATDVFVLLPYMFLAYLSFPFQLGLSFGSEILAFSFSAGLLSLVLYGVNLLAVKRTKHRT